MSQLLQTARAMEDQNFVWRVSAAMLHQAEYLLGLNEGVSVEGKKLAEWVIANPMIPINSMIAMAAVNATVAEKVVVDTNGGVNTGGVPDTDIKYVVGAKWEVVARQQFPAVPEV